MASIRKRGNKYEVRVIRRNAPSQCKSFTTLKDAQVWAKRIELAIERGEAIGQESVQLSSLIERYQTTVSPSKKGASQELMRMGAWLKHPFAAREARSIRPCEVAAWRDKRLSQVSSSTVRLELAALSVVFAEAIKEWGYTLTNPVATIKKPSPARGRDRRLAEGELDKLIASTESVVLKSVLVLAVETAMRRSEMVNLRWQDLELDRCVLTLHDTKNGESRVVPLSQVAISLLSSLPRDTDKIFNVQPRALSVAFHRACKRAKIHNLRLHDLRHEAASRLFERGLNMMEVASVTGHKTLAMLKRYTHLNPTDIALKLAA